MLNKMAINKKKKLIRIDEKLNIAIHILSREMGCSENDAIIKILRLAVLYNPKSAEALRTGVDPDLESYRKTVEQLKKAFTPPGNTNVNSWSI